MKKQKLFTIGTSKLSLFFLALYIVGCTSFRGHNRAINMDVVLTGGVYKKQSWDDNLVFERTSFYEGSKLLHDVLITKIDKNSPFRWWFGSQKYLLTECREVFVALFYRDINAFKSVSIGYIRSEIMSTGLKEVVIQDFAYNLGIHYAFDQWVLDGHKVFGYCSKQNKDIDQIKLTMPGHKTRDLL